LDHKPWFVFIEMRAGALLDATSWCEFTPRDQRSEFTDN